MTKTELIEGINVSIARHKRMFTRNQVSASNANGKAKKAYKNKAAIELAHVKELEAIADAVKLLSGP